MKKKFLFLLVCLFGAISVSGAQKPLRWVGTWATSPQWITEENIPPSPGLSGNSLRQVVRVSIGGERIRVKLSNEYSKDDLVIQSAYVAVSTGGSSIDATTNKYLLFDGGKSISIPAGKAVWSDSRRFHLLPLQQIAITINYGKTPALLTGHPGSRTTSYLISGQSAVKKDFAEATVTDHWYTISAIDVDSHDGACVAVLGNSITDGRGSTTNMQNRWTDVLAAHLQDNPETRHVGVLNLGIGGNFVLAGGLGDPAVKRFHRDIIQQSSVKWLILYEGINDLGNCRDGQAKAEELITAYKQMIAEAHSLGIRVYGATITPFKKHYYYAEQHELGRQLVNAWIRNSGFFDGVIDFDEIMRDPSDPETMNEKFQSDYLHPNAEGYRMMGSSINTTLFR